MVVRYSELLSKIPDSLFEWVGAEYKIDKLIHKLTWKSLFQILLYNICEEDKISLRVIEESFEEHQFTVYHKGNIVRASKSGISERLKAIDYRYYESIFSSLRKSIGKDIVSNEGKNIELFDSILVTLSSKLLKCGFKTSTGSNH